MEKPALCPFDEVSRQRPVDGASSPDVLAAWAPSGFKSLGVAAAPAVPELERLMNDRGAPPVAQANAAWVLANLGSNGLPALLAVITNTNQATTKRARTISLIAGTPDCRLEQGPAVPVLIDCLNDKDWYVAQQAARALGEIRMEPDIVVPALANCLKDPRVEVREQGLRALASYRERAVPALLEAQVGASNEFRKLIDGTLEYVAMHQSKTNGMEAVLTNGVTKGGPSP